VAASHSLTVLSSLPEARVLPSGLKATDQAQLFCPPRVAEFLAMATSHSLIVPAALAMVLPSAVIASPRSHPGPPTLKVTRSFGSRADEEDPSCFVSFFGSVLAAASLRGSAADTQATTKIISNGVFIGTPGKKLTGRDTAGADATYRSLRYSGY